MREEGKNQSRRMDELMEMMRGGGIAKKVEEVKSEDKAKTEGGAERDKFGRGAAPNRKTVRVGGAKNRCSPTKPQTLEG